MTRFPRGSRLGLAFCRAYGARRESPMAPPSWRWACAAKTTGWKPALRQAARCLLHGALPRTGTPPRHLRARWGPRAPRPAGCRRYANLPGVTRTPRQPGATGAGANAECRVSNFSGGRVPETKRARVEIQRLGWRSMNSSSTRRVSRVALWRTTLARRLAGGPASSTRSSRMQRRPICWSSRISVRTGAAFSAR